MEPNKSFKTILVTFNAKYLEKFAIYGPWVDRNLNFSESKILNSDISRIFYPNTGHIY